MKYKPQRMLVTGGAGFIGANFVRHALQHNPSLCIVNLDKLTYAGNIENLSDIPNKRHQFIQGDICDAKLIHQILRKHQVDTIVHFAAESHVDRSISGPENFVQTNIIGTFTLLDQAKSYWIDELKFDDTQCRFHHISTDEVYGSLSPNDAAFTEAHAYEPNSPYSATKAGSDHLVRAWQHTYGLPTTTSNCSNNYGPYQHTEKLIPTVIRACINKEPIPVYGDGSNIRDWLFVTDHCLAIENILNKGRVGETYNIGGRCELSNISLVRMICNIMDQLIPKSEPYENLINFITDRPGHDWRYAIDDQKIATELSWSPATELHEGLAETIQWYLAT